MKFVVLFMVLQTLHLIQSQGKPNDCGNLEEETCALCLQKPGCAWCSDETYSNARCNTPANHQKYLCPSNHTINPQAEQKPENPTGGTSQTSPSKIKLTLRVDERVTFSVKVKPAKDYPVDLYYLMDLSATMEDDLENIKNLSGQISKKLSELTSKQRLAFGSFVDKETAPYVKFEEIGKPFCPKCDKPYDFKHVLDFTESGTTFETAVKKVKSSGNRDIAEGTLDALMQIAACESELNWRPTDSCRRIVLIATDGLFHMASDGKLGAIVEPNDSKCYLSDLTAEGVKYYSKSTEMDYPSISQIFKRLQKSRIHPIFAVPVDQGESGKLLTKTYQSLVSSWKDLGATFGNLDADSKNIVELITESYKKIVSTIQITYDLPEGIEISVTPICGNAETLGEKCAEVQLGNEVSFDISIKATTCENGNSSSFKIVPIGYGDVQVDLSIICSCACQDIKTYNSSVCGGNGTLVCGRCDCNTGWSGRKCQCDPSKFQAVTKDDECKMTNTSTTICERNGDCDCGQCQCYSIANTGGSYYGKYCQCSDFNCEQHNNKLCGGKDRGKCTCGKCDCKIDFIGTNCGEDNCAKKIENCLDDKGVNCSGHGFCDCGTCKCDSFYGGSICGDCPTCQWACDDFKQCVLCEVFGHVPANKTTCANCPEIVKLDSTDDFKNYKYRDTCSGKDSDGCTYNFAFGSEKGENITIYAVTKKECPEGPDILVIVLAVIAGIVGIGIILLLLWKLLTAMVDRREYQRFEQDRAKSKWHREKNPLYQPATSTVQNPTFVGAKT